MWHGGNSLIIKGYEVVDMQGKRWTTTLTAKKAVRVAKELEALKGIKFQVKAIVQEVK